ncbi:MAG: TetR/AcrR family transcriptional regulator, partial [Fervidobacterium sp.]
MARDSSNFGKYTKKSKKLNNVKSSKRNPQRIDGIFTKNKIKLSAIKLFSKKRFSEVSVSQISKAANMSAGAFYQYYVNKDELFRGIIDEIFSELSSAINGISLTEVAIKFLNFGFQNPHLVKVIHLNEYSFDWIRHEYDNILKKISKSFELTSIGHFYFWSPLKFVVSFADLLEINVIPERFVYFLVSGIIENCDEKANMEKLFEFEPTHHLLAEDKRRERILANAESLFGVYGFEKTQVYDIAKASGVAVGTIYLYFENKLEVLRELV